MRPVSRIWLMTAIWILIIGLAILVKSPERDLRNDTSDPDPTPQNEINYVDNYHIKSR